MRRAERARTVKCLNFNGKPHNGCRQSSNARPRLVGRVASRHLGRYAYCDVFSVAELACCAMSNHELGNPYSERRSSQLTTAPV